MQGPVDRYAMESLCMTCKQHQSPSQSPFMAITREKCVQSSQGYIHLSAGWVCSLQQKQLVAFATPRAASAATL